MKIEGKVAIITGGSSGIGEACVRLFHSLNCKVVIADRDVKKGESLVKELGSNNAVFIETDVTDERSIENMINKTVALYSQIHIVVNSAGVAWFESTASVKSVHSTETFERVIRINVLGTFNVCKYAAQKMMNQDFLPDSKEKGLLINIASIEGLEGQRGTIAYSTSKGAIVGITLPLARDLGKYGIRVMTIAPGLIETAMGNSVAPSLKQLMMEQTTVGRLGRAEEVAGLCKALAENEYMSGEVIRIAGGARGTHL